MSHKIIVRSLVAALISGLLAWPSDAQIKRPRRPAPKTDVFTIKGEPAKAPPPPPAKSAEPESYGFTIENWKAVITVNKDGSSVATTEVSERLETKAALNSFGKFRVEFNSDMSDLSVAEAYYVKPDGTKKDFSPNAFVVKLTPQAEAAPSFSSLKMMQVDLGEAEPGDLIHYKTIKTDKKNYFDGKFDDFFVFENIVNWRSAEIELSAPADYPLQVQAVDLTGGKLPDTEDGRAHWHWSLKDKKAIEPGEIFNDQIGSGPKLAVSGFKDYAELGSAYWAEAEKKAVVTPEVQRLADEITRDAKTPEQQAYDIYQWVNKNIRYLSIVLDRGGWVPHSTTEILANRYGDCKDYSTILNALLKAKNIESYPVLIRSDFTNWFPSVAVPAFFNHAILYIPSLDLFADATNENTRLGLIPQTIVGKKAFLAGTKVGVIQVPSDRPDDNQMLSTVNLTVTANGDVKAVSKNSYVGRTEILFRPIFSSSDVRSSSEFFVAAMLHYFGQDGTGKILRIADPFKVNEPFEIELEVSLNNYTDLRPSGTFTIPMALNLNNPLSLEALVRSEKRQTDFNFGATRIREDYLVAFPAGVTPQASESFEYSNDVGVYSKKFLLENGNVRVIRELVIKKDVISAAQYPLLRELIKKLVANYIAEIKYVSTVTPRPSRSVAAAAPTVKSLFSPFDRIPGFAGAKPLSARQAAALEASLQKNPDDKNAHRDLLFYYAGYHTKDTPLRIRSRVRHYIWFVEHFPESTELQLIGTPGLDNTASSPEYKAVWPAWLAAVAKDKLNSTVRLNAYKFANHFNTDDGEQLLAEGMRLDPENYQFPFTLSERYSKKFDPAKPEPDAERSARVKKELEYGRVALDLLKKERSSERDRVRMNLLQDLAKAAFDADELESAKKLATELILDFGQNDYSSNYDSAAHIGNIVLGRVALKENNVAKAGEYLLIAIKAPLRKEDSWLPDIDTDLARDLLKAGQKDVVLEYLKLCEGLSNLRREKDLFADTIKALKRWQDQIKAGQAPSWDIYKP